MVRTKETYHGTPRDRHRLRKNAVSFDWCRCERNGCGAETMFASPVVDVQGCFHAITGRVPGFDVGTRGRTSHRCLSRTEPGERVRGEFSVGVFSTWSTTSMLTG